MTKRTKISTENAYSVFGPFSQAIKTDHLVFTSGQLPIDPATGEMVKGSIQEETRQVLNNVSAILTAAGTSLENAVKVTIFITDMNNFAAVNEVYAEYFHHDTFPARSTVEVSALAKGARVEIEAIALSQ